MTELDVYRRAMDIRARHGAGAAMYAVVQACDMLRCRDMGGLDAWRRIADAIRVLERHGPPPAGLVH